MPCPKFQILLWYIAVHSDQCLRGHPVGDMQRPPTSVGLSHSRWPAGCLWKTVNPCWVCASDYAGQLLNRITNSCSDMYQILHV